MAAKDRIMELRKKAGMTQEQLAKALNTTKQTIYKYEKGFITNIPLDRVEKMAEIFGVKPQYITGWGSTEGDNGLPANILPLPKMNRIPLVGTIACGTPILAQENIECHVDIPEYINADFALRCKGDSMIGARIYDGDIVYIRQQPDVIDGEIAAVLIDDEATLKRVYKIGSRRLELRAENPSFPVLKYEGKTLAEVKIIGKAVYFTSAVR